MADVDYKILGKKVAFIAILGVTGLIALGTINLYRLSRGLETYSLDGEN